MSRTSYVFLGNTDFSAAVLAALAKGGHPPALVICNPDRPAGRKKIMTSPPAKKLASDLNLKIYQPEKLDPGAVQTLSSQKYDFFVLADYGKILPKEILELPRLGVVGVHVSLLPLYRGASPMQTAILNGDDETGVTLYLLDEKLDHGPVVAVRKFSITGFTFSALRDYAAKLAGKMLNDILPEFSAGKIQPRPQDEARASYTKKFTTEDALVAPEELAKALAGDAGAARVIDRKIRALNPEPGAWTIQNGKRVKLLASETKAGSLLLKKIQVEGETSKTPPGGFLC